MPGVLIVEALAQASAIFFLLTKNLQGDDEAKNVFFMSIDRCKFRKQVIPGDTLYLKVWPEIIKEKVCRTRCEAYVDDVLACQVILMARMEI